MKKNYKNILLIFILKMLICAGFTTCNFENPIMETWWQEDKINPAGKEIIYADIILREIPVVTIETIVEKEIVYQTVFVELPPEIVYETVFKDKYIYEIVYEKVYIPGETIYEIVYETIVEYVEKEVIIYETIIETVEVPVEVPGPPTKEEIINYIKDPGNTEEIIKIIKDTEIIYETIKEWIIQTLTEEEIKEIIKNIPPEYIKEYLTDEQIKYIVKQQPPEVILQSISIIGIEYIIFSGNQTEYNKPAASGAASNLTQVEKDTNDVNVKDMAKHLAENPDYLIILHGHANPTKAPNEEGYEQDLYECKLISNGRAESLAEELNKVYKTITGGEAGIYPSDRLTTSGYGGEKNLSSENSLYAGLNRRVEMILFKIVETRR